MDINRYSPSYTINKLHLTKLSAYSTEEIFELLYATRVMKAKFIAHEDTNILKGTTVAFLFGDTSLRTRSALAVGIKQLGGDYVDLPYNEKDMAAGENAKDFLNVICRYGVGALVTRGIPQKDLKEFINISTIPIINSTNDEFVPMQIIGDLFTIWEKKKKLEGLKLAYVGKGTNIASTLIMGAIKCGMEVAVATPDDFAIRKEHLDSAGQYGKIFVTQNPAEAVTNADIVYTDSYDYHSTPSEEEKRILLPYQVNKQLMSLANHNALFMHPLPANRGMEVTADVIDGSSSVVYDQAENRLHTVKAVFTMLVK